MIQLTENKNMTFLDIETGPWDRAAIFKPEFEAPKNIKDPLKIAQAIADKEQAWLDSLALDAKTGQVLVVGLLEGKDETFRALEGDEKTILQEVWAIWSDYKNRPFVGFNILGFDLPFMIRRSYLNGIAVPPAFFQFSRYKTPDVIDVMKFWSLWSPEERISLDNFSKFTSVGEKSGSGAEFAELYRTDRNKAMEYLKNDLGLTAAIFKSVLAGDSGKMKTLSLSDEMVMAER